MEFFQKIYDTNHFSLFHLSDIHEGSANHNSAEFRRHINIINLTRQSGRKVAVSLGGDIIECIAVDDKRFSPTEIDEKYKIRDLKDLPKKQADYVMDELDPIIDCIDFAIVGNHEEKYIKQHHFDVYDHYCKKMNCAKLGGFGIAILKLNGNGHEFNLNIGVAHGSGGGNFKTPGYPLTYCKERFQKFGNLDINIIGHIHKLEVHPFPSIEVYNKRLENRPALRKRFKYYCIAGCYLETYVEGNSGYFEGRPGELSEIGMLEIKADRTENGWEYDVIKHEEIKQ